ncbi:MAG: type II toxin-antitoxin system VapC family toxin, partial [Deltaproteobacteria bacterium]|nr:type II toxin-antitoxin system VapC family toxin [Deltaproteobacteria bacterium]
MKSQEKIVIDAWGLLALIFGEEPAATDVKKIFEDKDSTKSSVNVSWINIGEVYYAIGRKKGLASADEVLTDLKLLPMTLHEPSKVDILSAARIKSRYKLSYADAFAVSLAEKINGRIVT